MASFGGSTKVSDKVFVRAGSTGASVSYTVPAGCYAILKFFDAGHAQTTGVLAFNGTSNSGSVSLPVLTFYLGPGESISGTITSGDACFSGVLFANA